MPRPILFFHFHKLEAHNLRTLLIHGLMYSLACIFMNTKSGHVSYAMIANTDIHKCTCNVNIITLTPRILLFPKHIFLIFHFACNMTSAILPTYNHIEHVGYYKNFICAYCIKSCLSQKLISQQADTFLRSLPYYHNICCSAHQQ